MPYNAGRYEIRLGTYNIASMGAAYAVTAFPVQTDMAEFGLVRWIQPIDPSGRVYEVDETIDALDGTRGGFGGYRFSWFFQPLTPNMLTYLRTTFFPSSVWSSAVTVRTWDRSYDWRYFNCIALWNDPAQIATPRGFRGYQGFRIDFINGTLAAA